MDCPAVQFSIPTNQALCDVGGGKTFSTIPLTPFKRYCLNDPHAGAVMSTLYTCLLTPPQDAIHNYMTRWTTDLGTEIDAED